MITELNHYVPPSKTHWQGRSDTSHGRFFQNIRLLDLQQHRPGENTPGIALLGFCCDEGIRRNHGRLGASEGPKAFRHALSGMAVPPTCAFNLYDAGDIVCPNQDLESAQFNLGKALNLLRQMQLFPIVIGGGHETAWGHYLGLQSGESLKDLAIVNFDAHFDMRDESQSTSGTPFMQIAQNCAYQNIPFHYYCFGIQPQSNTKALFDAADQYQVHYKTAQDIHTQANGLKNDILEIIKKHQTIYLTVCLDVFAYPYAPGVSAVSAQGLTPWQVIEPLILLAQSQKVISMDIVELSPKHDQNQITAKLSATIASYFMDTFKKGNAQ